ncbi:MAG: hypothetical protein M1817_005186 [Caeruleum heppii]|nr:MAG: hypothetical protein M1817_005186 [Caeruleum heppii]
MKRSKLDEAESELEGSQTVTNKVFWPADLLPITLKDAKIEDAKIMTYGYDADVIAGPLQGASKNTITQHGRDLMAQLEREVGNTAPIIFVVHSLGGIIVKEALHWAKTNRAERYQALHHRIKHIVFLGTPHRGSRMASMGDLVANFAAVALQDTNKAILKSLAVDSEILDRVHDDFAGMLYDGDFTVHSFQEGRGISGVKPADGKASVPPSPTVLTDHPADLALLILGRIGQDPGYRKVSGVLVGYVAQIKQDSEKNKHSSEVLHNAEGSSVVLQKQRVFHVDQLPSQYFTGRRREIEYLEEQLKPVGTLSQQRRVVVWGCGGAGKSQLVTKFICTHTKDFSDVFWVLARTESSLRDTFADIARQLGLAEKLDFSTTDSAGVISVCQGAEGLSRQQRAITAVKDWFSRHETGDWLLVVDNADDLKTVNVESFLPQTMKGNIIITSRNRQAQAFGPAVELAEMDVEDAESLLLRRSGIQQPSSDEKGLAARVTQNLGYLALAIEHAGAYIQSVDGSLAEYLEEFKTNRKTLLSESYGVSKDNQSVFRTFDISFKTIIERNQSAAKLLTFLGFLDGDGVQESLILDHSTSVENLTKRVFRGHTDYLSARRDLLSFSLIRVKTNNTRKTICVHPLVHYFSRARLDQDKFRYWSETAAYFLITSTSSGQDVQLLYPHTMKFCEHMDAVDDAPDSERLRGFWVLVVSLMQQYHYHWHAHGAMAELERYVQRAIRVLETGRGSTELMMWAAAISISLSARGYAGAQDDYQGLLRRFWLKQMTSKAVITLLEAERSDGLTLGGDEVNITADQSALSPGDFSPSIMPDIFSNVDDIVPEHAKLLSQFLSVTATTCAGYKHWSLASLFGRMAELPLTIPSSGPDGSLDPSQLIVSAARDADAFDFDSVCSKYSRLLNASDPTRHPQDGTILKAAYDYSKFLIKLGRPQESEVIIRRFLVRDESDDSAYHRLQSAAGEKSMYIWCQKIFAAVQTRQGRFAAAHTTLLKAHAFIQRLSGPDTLGMLHAAFLLQTLHEDPVYSTWKIPSYLAEMSNIFKKLYGGSEAKVAGGEGLNMGIILLAQGGLEEAIIVIKLFVELAVQTLGAEHAVSRKAERLLAVAREERNEEVHATPPLNLMKYGCLTVFRNVEALEK